MDEREREAEGNMALALAGALIAAIVGGVLWALITVWTEYELGLVAWAIGGMAGFAVAFCSRYRTSQIHQMIAVLASLLGILVGKFLLFGYFLNGGFTGMFDSTTISIFQREFTDLFRGMDIVFILFAVITAWRIPAQLRHKAAQPAETAEESTTI